ncbi:MAG: hypothetical protein ACTSU6_03285 [Candidatus Njordarchaeales archaeon]
MNAVSNTSPIIFLSKIGMLDKLFYVFKVIYIPPTVHKEILKGKEKYSDEVLLISENIGKKIIIQKLNDRAQLFSKKLIKAIKGIHPGEAEAIALTKQLNLKKFLVDDKKGYKLAEMLDLTPLRTTQILLLFLKRKIINLEEFKGALLKLSKSGFWITLDVYELLLKNAEKLYKSSKKNSLG